MKRRRKIIGYIAASADGYIARPDLIIGFGRMLGKASAGCFQPGATRSSV